MLSKIKEMILDETLYYFFLHHGDLNAVRKHPLLVDWCTWYLESTGSRTEFVRMVSEQSIFDNLTILELTGELDKLAVRFKQLDQQRKDSKPF